MEFSVMQCIPTIYILDMRISSKKMERTSKSSSSNPMPSSSILSIIGGALIIIGGLTSLTIKRLTIKI
jgi:hypothetical protein